MTDSSPLERRYRRVLACYPKAFRRESEDEILAVLLATAAALLIFSETASPHYRQEPMPASAAGRCVRSD